MKHGNFSATNAGDHINKEEDLKHQSWAMVTLGSQVGPGIQLGSLIGSEPDDEG
jgi:hypothetical protein